MDLLRIVQLLTYSFGIYAFGSLIVMGFRARPRAVAVCPSDYVSAVYETRFSHVAGMLMLAVSFVWFGVMLAHTLDGIRSGNGSLLINVSHVIVMHQFPPLIALVNYASARNTPAALTQPIWKRSLIALCVASESIMVYILLAASHVVPVIRPFGAFIGLSISALFALAAIYSSLAVNATRKLEKTERDSGTTWMLGLYLMMLLLVGLIVAASWLEWPVGEVLSFVGTSLPLVFMFTATYHESRFEFFDLFIKRGLLVLVSIVLLTLFFGIVLPRLETLELGVARPWVYAIILLPVVLSLPWAFRTTGRWLDNVWLGRRLTTLQAIKRFLADLGQAADRPELVRHAEAGLQEIFNAPVRIRLDLEQAPDLAFNCVQEIPVRSQEIVVGTILLGRRANQVPYFSADLALLGSLAEVFSYMLRAVDLHEKKRELTLQASRSELKALRAQINPHFLFNALNAIASLIHHDPARADETVEQLAEIFRYTLRGSESEWTTVAQEMDFVRSYLEVERSRFGDKLTVEVRAEPEIENHVVPTMMIQTLVENAVKHGVARVRGPARVDVRAWADGDQLRISVHDDGPGFDADAARRPRGSASEGGYGLHNIRERLRGHFGDRARFEVTREAGRTAATLVFPVELLERARRRGGARPGAA